MELETQKKKNYLWQIEKKHRKLEEYTSDTTLMDFYFVTLDGRTSQYSVMLRLLSSV